MTTNYPAALDTTAELPDDGVLAAGNLSTFSHSDAHGNANDAIIAIETELGAAPSGTFSTVKARLDDINDDVSTLWGYAIVADFGLSFQTTDSAGTFYVATGYTPVAAFCQGATAGTLLHFILVEMNSTRVGFRAIRHDGSDATSTIINVSYAILAAAGV